MAGEIERGAYYACGAVKQQLRSAGTLCALGALTSRSSVLARLVPSASHAWVLAVRCAFAISLVGLWCRRRRLLTGDDLVEAKRTPPSEERLTARRWRRGQWLLGIWVAASTMARSGQLAREPSLAPEQLELLAIPATLAGMYAAGMHSSAQRFVGSTPSPLITAVLIALPLAIASLVVGPDLDSRVLAWSCLRALLDAACLLGLRAGFSGEDPVDFAVGMASSAALTTLVVVLLEPTYFHQIPTAGDVVQRFGGELFLTTALSDAFLVYALAITRNAVAPLLALFLRNSFLLDSIGGLDSTLRSQLESLRILNGLGVLVAAYSFAMWATTAPASATREVSTDEEAGVPLLPAGARASTGAILDSASPIESKPLPVDITRRGDSNERSSRMKRIIPLTSVLVSVLAAFLLAILLQSTTSCLTTGDRTGICPFATGWTSASPPAPTVDIAIAYYDEDFVHTHDTIVELRQSSFLAAREQRVIVYNKGPHTAQRLRRELALSLEDEVVALPNVGREGATYLKHILLHYNETLGHARDPASDTLPLRRRRLADLTYFFQPHIAWDGDARPRIAQVLPETGFVNFGPNIRFEGYRDTEVGIEFSLIDKIWSAFRPGDDSKAGPRTGSWSGQFAVSKRRILANPYAAYANISELIEAPAGHWIHEGWGPNESGGPSNPVFGHALERAWPVMFDCFDPAISEACPHREGAAEKCQCFDDPVEAL